MNKASYILLGAFLILILGCNTNRKESKSESPLVKYLQTNWQSPEDYVIGKFDSHDYVILGEMHYFKNDIDLVLNLIPKLYENGIYNLAIEFGSYPEQNLVDSLLKLPFFDRKLARQIVFKCEADWAFKEYIDIYKVAWEVNHSANSDTNKFRVINIGYSYYPCEEGLDRFGGHHPDKYMAENVLKEIVSKNQKALIYTGSHHAFTKYHQPSYDFENDTLYRLEYSRMGNVLYDTLKDRTFNIFLNAPWISAEGYDEPLVLPVMGVIDSLMQFFKYKPVGFDVYNSPFGNLTSNNTLYAFGYKDFTLKMFCDGYIYQGEFKNYENVTMEKDFITSENLDDLKSFLKCAEWSEEAIDSITIKNANEKLFYDYKVFILGHLIE